jgi:hypothetical protein
MEEFACELGRRNITRNGGEDVFKSFMMTGGAILNYLYVDFDEEDPDPSPVIQISNWERIVTGGSEANWFTRSID